MLCAHWTRTNPLNCTTAACASMQTKEYSSCVKYNVRADGDGLFSWLRDVHGVDMSGTVVGLVMAYFMDRVFV